MYGFLALLALGLAAVSEGTRLGLNAILADSPAARDLSGQGMKTVQVLGDKVILEKREGGTVEINDAQLAKSLHDSVSSHPRYLRTKRTAVTHVKNLFKRDDGCDYICGHGANTCSTVNNGYGYCSCLKDCGPEGEECFSTCFPP